MMGEKERTIELVKPLPFLKYQKESFPSLFSLFACSNVIIVRGYG